MTQDSVKTAVGQDVSHGQDSQQKQTAAQWLTENRAALIAYNAWVETHGLPLDEYRLF